MYEMGNKCYKMGRLGEPLIHNGQIFKFNAEIF